MEICVTVMPLVLNLEEMTVEVAMVVMNMDFPFCCILKACFYFQKERDSCINCFEV